MLVKNIFMELRSRLCSCNVYITTGGIDFNKNYNLKISIKADCIVLNYYPHDGDEKLKRSNSYSSIESLSDCYSDEELEFERTTVISIEEYCKIIPNSMSCLKIEKDNISFRILTEQRQRGSFYAQFLAIDNLKSNVSTNSAIINVKSEEDLKITCANCSNQISNGAIKFDRILELPSTNLDMSEWFCHGHGNTPKEEVLKPNKNDFLYRLTYFVINNSALSEKTNKFNSKREIYHCNRCLAWLGLKNKDTVKLFNSEVKSYQNGVDGKVFGHKNSLGNSAIDDFIYTIENVAKEFNIGFQYAVMCKLVLECTMSKNNKQYLLIWIMDKELQVLRNNVDCKDSKEIQLQSSFLTKILYKIEPSINEEVELWQSDPGVVTTEISKSMFNLGLEHLKKTSLSVPESFRMTNGYHVTYLKV